MTDDGGNDWNNRKKVCLSWRGKYHDITNQGHQRFCKMSVRRNKCYLEQNQASLVYYSIVRSPLIKRESKLCYFPKICSNTNSSKTWHLQDLTRLVSLSPLRTICRDEQLTFVFIVAVNQDKYKKESSRIL